MSIYNYFRDLNHKRLQRRLLPQQEEVARFWEPVIRDYYDGKIEKYRIRPKKDLGTKKIIWQYWGQGFEPEQLPEIVRITLRSVDQYKGDALVVRLSDETISEYIDFPPFILDQLEHNPHMTRTFFSDLLRLALLEAYGGAWLDATILLSGPIPERYFDYDFFAFQLPDEHPNKDFWSTTVWGVFCWDPRFKVRFHSALMFAHPDSEIVSTLLDLMLYYWKVKGDEPVAYYHFFQVLFHELVQVGPLRAINCPIESYSDFESLILIGRGRWRKDFETAHELLSRYPFHKLTFKHKKDTPQIIELLKKEGF